MSAVRVRAETPTGRLVGDRAEVRLDLVCGCYEIRLALPSPLKWKNNRVPHENCPRAGVPCAQATKET